VLKYLSVSSKPSSPKTKLRSSLLARKEKMKKRTSFQLRHKRTLFLCRAAIIAAIYFALTMLCAAFGLSSGVIQIRLSEMLCVLPIFTTAAIPGLTLGCLISNLLTGAIWQDVVFGTLATFIGALGAYPLRKIKWLTPLPTVIANALIIPPVLAYGYGATEGIPFLMLTVGVGEIISAYIFGLILIQSLKGKDLFNN